MSKLSITVDTEDKTALKAVYSMLRSLMCGGASIPAADIPTGAEITRAAIAEDKPTLKVVPQPTNELKLYEVDGREYTAEQVLWAKWNPAELLAKGWPAEQIAEVLNIPIDDVVPENATPESPSTAPATTVELDSAEMPWDARIHAGTKTKVAAGTWKKKPRVDPLLVEQVEAELINLMEIEPAADLGNEGAVIPPPASTEAPVVIPPPVAVPEPAPEQDEAMTFAEFLKACSAKMTAGETTMDRILGVVTAKGIASLQLVNSRQDLIPELWAEISIQQKVEQ